MYPNRNYYRLARKNSYGGIVARENKYYIIIHNTGNNGDTAKNNVDYFATGNTRSAGAQLFIDQSGNVAQSMPINYIAYSVGDKKNGMGTMFGTITNTNSISIELCDIVSKDCSAKMIESLKNVIAWIKSVCPNIKGIYRHYDVTTKSCPTRYINNEKWNNLKFAISGGTTTTTTKEKLVVDGWFGGKSISRLQEKMGTPVDGFISGQLSSLKPLHFRMSNVEYSKGGSSVVKAWQRYVGADPDGQFGNDSITKTRIALNLDPEGGFDALCVKAFQTWLNE